MATLNWIGKEAVVNHHREVPYRLLKGDPKLSVGENGGVGSGNLLVQGDNLEALKALLPYYGGKVKCIYIDPPLAPLPTSYYAFRKPNNSQARKRIVQLSHYPLPNGNRIRTISLISGHARSTP
jgi:hypothetical protein